jgi:hypothetical protein
MKQTWAIQFFRYSIVYVFFYLPVRFAMPLTLRLVGYKRAVVGTCTILAPQEKMQLILQGLTYLQTLDSGMFQRLTAKRRYVFWYYPNRYLRCFELFTITDNFLSWGSEGVVACFVQSVLALTLKKPFPFKKFGAKVLTRSHVQQQVIEWLEGHSFSPAFTKHYQNDGNQ